MPILPQRFAAAIAVAAAIAGAASAIGFAENPEWAGHVAAWTRGARLVDAHYGVRQRRGNDCGPAALIHAIRELGVTATYPDSRLVLTLGPNGCSLPELERAAEAFEVSARVVRLAPSRVGEVRTPAVLHLRRGHYIVLEGSASGEELRVHDPSLGLLAQTPEALSRNWSGWALELDRPTGGFPDRDVTSAGEAPPGARSSARGTRSTSAGSPPETGR